MVTSRWDKSRTSCWHRNQDVSATLRKRIHEFSAEEGKKAAAHPSGEGTQAAATTPTTAGLQVWRINKLKLEVVPEVEHGVFYDGDSYVVLSSCLGEDGETLANDLFIWIGSYSTIDEYSTASVKMVELHRNMLHGCGVQHREVQGAESDAFQAIFPRLEVRKGGHEAFSRGRQDDVPLPKRLLHVSGNRSNVKVVEVSYRFENLTEDDVFILDHGQEILQLNGAKSSPQERAKGAESVQLIKSSRKGCTVRVIDEFSPETHEYEVSDMPRKKIRTKKVVSTKVVAPSLWRLSDSTGELDLSKVTDGKPTYQDFQSEDVFIYDSGRLVYVWIGRETSLMEKLMALAYAEKYISVNKRGSVPVVAMNEGNESQHFRGELR